MVRWAVRLIALNWNDYNQWWCVHSSNVKHLNVKSMQTANSMDGFMCIYTSTCQRSKSGFFGPSSDTLRIAWNLGSERFWSKATRVFELLEVPTEVARFDPKKLARFRSLVKSDQKNERTVGHNLARSNSKKININKTKRKCIKNNCRLLQKKTNSSVISKQSFKIHYRSL